MMTIHEQATFQHIERVRNLLDVIGKQLVFTGNIVSSSVERFNINPQLVLWSCLSNEYCNL